MIFWALRWHEGRRVSYRVLCDVLWGDFVVKPVDPVAALRTLVASVQNRYRHKWIIEDCGRGFRIALRKPAHSESRSAAFWKRRFAAIANDEVRRLGSLPAHARVLGFTSQEAYALLRWAEGSRAACAEVREMTSAHLNNVRVKIADLKATDVGTHSYLVELETSLSEAVRRCADGESRRKCRLIEALSSAMTMTKHSW